MSGADTDRRRALLVAALGFARLGQPLVQRWLSTWTGVGLIGAGMARQGYDLALTRYADLGWRASFYVAGREHSPTGAIGSGFAPTPFGAVQAAAWEALARA